MRLSCLLLTALNIATIAEIGITAEPVIVKKSTAEFLDKDSGSLASGSGLLVAPNLVITNRHVVEEADGDYYDGFKVALGPSFKKENAIRARLVRIATNYDLALIELEKPAAALPIRILKNLPELGTTVRAYGFPLGSSFGVGLTVSGGQVSRHPLPDDTVEAGGGEESQSIRRSMWHDAIIASGSSGGPLFSESGVLLGLNFAQIVKSKHALAVPGESILEFLERSGLPNLVSAVDTLGETQSIAGAVVYIESLRSNTHGQSKKQSGKFDASVFSDLIAKVKAPARAAVIDALSKADPKSFYKIRKGDIGLLFPPQSGKAITSKQLVRVSGSTTIILVTDTGAFVDIDDVMCFVALPESAELAAKYSTGSRVTTDFVYWVETVVKLPGDDDIHIYPMVRLMDVMSSEEIDEAIAAEKGRRDRESKVKQREQYAQLANKFRRTFHDKTGKFSIDATCVRYADGNVTLINFTTGKEIEVKTGSLSLEDQNWLSKNQVAIRLNGKFARLHFEESGAPQP